jgi:hypothetical protein
VSNKIEISPKSPRGHPLTAAPIASVRKVNPDIINIPHVLILVKEYLSARQPRVGFAKPNPTPLTRARGKKLSEAKLSNSLPKYNL